MPSTGTTPSDATGTLTACLIVRDEEAHLADCLASVAPFVDEVVVVDTGSTDGTPGIARASGARVLSVAWTDDFSAARNAALAACSTPWVLSLDADERVGGDPARLRALLDRAPHGDRADAAFGVTMEQAGADGQVLRLRGAKLFRPALVHWRGRVHERPVHRSGPRAGVEVAGRPLPRETLLLTHLGYLAEGALAVRALRNARLAELELDDLIAAGAPASEIARARLNLGRSLRVHLDPTRGEALLQQVRSETTPGTPTWLWAVHFLAWEAVRRGDPDTARGLCVELQAAGAPADYLLNLAAVIAYALGDAAAGDRFRAQIARRVDVTGRPC